MNESIFIAGDWGTTHLRLYLCDATHVLAMSDGPGVAQCRGDHQQVLQHAIAEWSETRSVAKLVLAGMVGSRNGWIEVPYTECPASAASIRAGLNWFDMTGLQTTIVPGLACINAMNAPDVMRGEETQIVGALELSPGLRKGTHLLALPGTHCKWVQLVEGRIAQFTTSLTGELFSILRQHSILVGGGTVSSHRDEVSFEEGVQRVVEYIDAALTQLLFEARSRQLRAGMSPAQAEAFLSGILIGHDVAGAIRIARPRGPVTLIGTALLCDGYRVALERFGIESNWIDGGEAVVAGLRSLAFGGEGTSQ